MNPFYSALEQGYSPEELIGYIQKAFPKFAEPIKKATKAGYSIQTILGFLSKNFDNENRAGMSESERHAANRRANTERVKFGLQVAGTALIAPFVASAAKGALSRALPSSLANLLGNDISPAGPQQPGALASPQINQPISPGATNPLQSASAPTSQTPQVAGQLPTVSQQPPNVPQTQPPVSPTIAQPSQPVQPQTTTIKPSDVLSKHNIKEKVDQILKAKNNPQSVSAYFEKFDSKSKKRIEKETGMSFEKVIEEYVNQKPEEESLGFKEAFGSLKGGGVSEKLYEGLFEALKQGKDTYAGIKDPILTKAKEPFEKGEIKSAQDLKEFVERKESPKIEKDSIVSTPHGVGEVKSIKEKNALVEVDGKLQKVPVEELQQEPEEVKNSKFDFDPSEIPEELRSAPLNEVYLPHDRRHITVKYNAGLKPIRYIYWRKDDKPIETDYINKIVKGVQLPVTSGLNFWGAWDASKSDSRGAANYEELISNSQEEGEPDDPSKSYWFIKEESIYTHPYVEKGYEYLRQKEKEFNEAKKKRKKKAT